jgi:hypothetical protein
MKVRMRTGEERETNKQQQKKEIPFKKHQT